MKPISRHHQYRSLPATFGLLFALLVSGTASALHTHDASFSDAGDLHYSYLDCGFCANGALENGALNTSDQPFALKPFSHCAVRQVTAQAVTGNSATLPPCRAPPR